MTGQPCDFEIPGTIRLEPGQGGLPKLTVTTRVSTGEIYLHGAQVTAFQRRGEPPPVKAVAIAADGTRSQVVTAKYHRIPHDWKITLESRYSSQYTGGGDFGLIDGIRGTANWSGGGWQGYQGKDFVAVVDLGSVQDVSRVGAGFLQDVGSWIYMPARVEIELSMDGRSFSPAISIANEVSEQQEGVIIRDFVKSIPSKQARYVKVRAVNLRPEKWIFVDEILIQ